MDVIVNYFSSLNPESLLRACPGGIAQGLIWGVMALGVYITFRMLNIADMTVDGSFASGGAVCVMLLLAGVNPHLALLASFGAGVIAGTITGLLHTKLGIPDILAGILTQISLYSINLNILGRANQSLPAKMTRGSLYFTGNTNYLTRTIIISAVVCALLVALLRWYLGTRHGSALRATGTNERMARAQGINTNRIKVIGLALCDGLVALSGGILSQFNGFADINMGRGAIVIGLAAVIIGEVLGQAFLRKRLNLLFTMIFVVLGAVIYYLVYVLVLWLKISPDNMKLLTAVVVAIFLAIPYLKDSRKNSFKRLARLNAKLEEDRTDA